VIDSRVSESPSVIFDIFGFTENVRENDEYLEIAQNVLCETKETENLPEIDKNFMMKLEIFDQHKTYTTPGILY